MRRFSLLLIVALALAGCGKNDAATEPEAKTNPKQTEPKTAGTNTGVEKPIPSAAFTNTLGMVFKPVPGTKVQFCIRETRVKDYASYAAENTGVDGRWKKPLGDEFKQTDTHPVVWVSWFDANAFCVWLTEKEMAAGKIKAEQKYRLPTDAEWSVAVGLGREKGNTPEAKSMGVKDVYPWGKEWPPPKGAGNYANYAQSFKVDSHEYTSPVGSFAANQHGLHDMGGNVWEWCENWYYDPTAQKYRVLRGASWSDFNPYRMLSSCRLDAPPPSSPQQHRFPMCVGG